MAARRRRGNRIEVLSTTSQNEKYGANASFAKTEGDHRRGRYDLGSPIFKFQDEQVFGNSFYLSAKLTSTNTGAVTKPMIDEAMAYPVVYDVAEGTYVPFSASFGRSWDASLIIRSGRDVEFTGTLYKDAFLGLAHEIKGGFLSSSREARSTTGMPQNYEITRNFTDPLIDLGEGLVIPPPEWQRFVVTRSNGQDNLTKRTSAFIQDTFAKGRFTFQLGLRYDYQQPSTDAVAISTVVSSWSNVYTNDAVTVLANYIPALTVDPIDPRYEWSTWSPRTEQ